MLKNFDDVQKISKDNLEATVQSFGAVSKGVQAIAAEVTEYSKKAFQDGTAVAEKLLGTKSLEGAIEVQTAYVKASYEAFVAQATKLSGLYADLAKETYKPYEGYFGKFAAK